MIPQYCYVFMSFAKKHLLLHAVIAAAHRCKYAVHYNVLPTVNAFVGDE